MEYQELINYITGNTSKQQADAVKEWITSDETHKQEFIRLKNAYALSQLSPLTSKKTVAQQPEFIALLTGEAKSAYRVLINYFRYAAIVILSITAGFGLSKLNAHLSQADLQAMNTLTAPVGQISEFTMSDGTRVWLNSGTSIQFPASFNAKNREVILDGEAYFEVTSDPNHPFLVTTSHLTVKVLGTAFNVNAYSNQDLTETTLVEGKVDVLDFNHKPMATLLPGQQLTHSKTTNRAMISQVDTTPLQAWKNGLLIFRDRSLGEIVGKLENWYNVEINLMDPEIKDYRFTGTILKNKPFDQILEVIKLSSPIAYQIEVFANERNQIKLYAIKKRK